MGRLGTGFSGEKVVPKVKRGTAEVALVSDAKIHYLLTDLLTQVKIMNLHLSRITGEELVEEDTEGGEN